MPISRASRKNKLVGAVKKREEKSEKRYKLLDGFARLGYNKKRAIVGELAKREENKKKNKEIKLGERL